MIVKAKAILTIKEDKYVNEISIEVKVLAT